MIKTIEQIKKSKKRILILHYACTSVNVPPVIVTNISVRDYSLNQTFSFSFDKYGNEHHLLAAFLNYMRTQKNYLLLTWNQKSSTYGIQHIEERCNHYKIPLFPIKYNNVIDLDDSLVEKYGQDYAPHSKLDNLAKLNNISMLGAESGLFEIELFKAKKYKRIENSTNRKVAMMADILRLSMKDSLKISKEKMSSSMLMAREFHDLRNPVSHNVVELSPNLHKSLIHELKTLQTKEKFKPGLYYIVWADLSGSTKSSEKLTPEDNEKKVTKFISFSKESLPKQLKNHAYFVKEIGDASLFLFNNFLDILNWKKTLDKKCDIYNKKISKYSKSKYQLIEYKVIVHLGEIHLDEKGDPKSLSLNQISKIEKDFKKNQFGITEKVRLVILPRVNSKQIKIGKIKEIKLQGEKNSSSIWNITEFKN